MSAVLQQNGWQAYLHLLFASRAGKTRLMPQQRFGPLSVQRPFYPEGDCCHTYLLHPPGGVVGSDSLQVQVQVERQAHALLTTPGATKFYRSGGRLAQVQQHLQVQSGAALEWLPQENIYFPGAELRAATRVDVDADSRFMGWEIHCLGRPANHEHFDTGELRLDLQLYRQGQALLLDRQRINAHERLRSSGLRGAAVQASLLMYAPDLEDSLLPKLRSLAPLSGHCGVTRLHADLIIARYLGPHTHHAQQWLRAIWRSARADVIGREAVIPRIWNT